MVGYGYRLFLSHAHSSMPFDMFLDETFSFFRQTHLVAMLAFTVAMMMARFHMIMRMMLFASVFLVVVIAV